jgi:uncharacterized lipoprotein YajG
MLSSVKVVLALAIAASFLLQGCSSTKSGESKCPFAKLVQKDATSTAANREIPATPDSRQAPN